MNWQEILTENAVEQFKKEGATVAVITLYNKATDKVIRDVEIQLEVEKHFAIAAKNSAAEAKMSAHFLGDVIDGEKWFPFACACGSYKPEDIVKLLQQVAKSAGVDTSHLKWSYMNDR